MDIQQEIVDSMKIIADDIVNKMTSPIYFGLVTSISSGKCNVLINDKTYAVSYYGGVPQVNNKYPIIVPYGNMSLAFLIGGDNKDVVPKPRLLWSGTWSTEGQAITVPNFSDYRVIKVESDTGQIAECEVVNGRLEGGSPYYSSDDWSTLWLFDATVSGNTLTLVKSIWYTIYDNDTDSKAITKIYGVYKPSDIIT